MTPDSLTLPPWDARGTSVAAVADELARRWTAATAAPGGTVAEKGMAVARASVMNLIVFVPTPAAADRALDLLLALGNRHPSRAIILIAEANEAAGSIDAQIRTHCLTGAAETPTCYDQVILTVRGEAARHLDGIVAPLVIHDLPTHVWWPDDPPLADPIFDQLVEIGDRVMVDTADFADLLTGLRRLGTIRHRSGVGDLCWERLAPWQEVTAEFFDAPRFRRYLPNLSRLTVSYAAGPSAAAYLYAGWLATRLGWRRVHRTDDGPGDHLRLEGQYQMIEINLVPEANSEHRPGEILHLRLRAHGEAGSAEFLVDRTDDLAAVVSNEDGMTARMRHMVLPDESDADVLRRQLSAGHRDLVYEDALRAAAILLGEARGTG